MLSTVGVDIPIDYSVHRATKLLSTVGVNIPVDYSFQSY